MVFFVLLLNAMAASPALHELVRQNAQAPGHECAVTLFAHGQVDSAGSEVTIGAPQTLVLVSAPVLISHFSPFISQLPAGRGPPVQISLPS